MKKLKQSVVIVLLIGVSLFLVIGCVFWGRTDERVVSYFELDGAVRASGVSGDRLYLKLVDSSDWSGNQVMQILELPDSGAIEPVVDSGRFYLPEGQLGSFAVYKSLILIEDNDWNTGDSRLLVVDPSATGQEKTVNVATFPERSDSGMDVLAPIGDYLVRVLEKNDYPSGTPIIAIEVYRMAEITTQPSPAPIATDSIPESVMAYEVMCQIREDLLYVANKRELHIYDVSDPQNLAKLSSCDLPAMLWEGVDLRVGDGFVCVVPATKRDSEDSRIPNTGDAVIIDVSDPSAPRTVAEIEEIGAPCAVSGKYLLSRSGLSIDVYDLSELTEPKRVKTLNVRLSATTIYPRGDIAVVLESLSREDGGVAAVLIAPYR